MHAYGVVMSCVQQSKAEVSIMAKKMQLKKTVIEKMTVICADM